jgi:hypothetical protein
MTTSRPRIPYTRRITAYLRRINRPQHYAVIARHIQVSPRATLRVCYRMAHDGRLRWAGEGTYGLPAQENTP